jgi:hypothetical protein
MKRAQRWPVCITLVCLVACGGNTTASTSTVVDPTADGGDAATAYTTDGGGGGPHAISAKDYDQRCTKTSDCAPVIDGDACIACSCATAAVSQAAFDAFEAKREELRKQCPPQLGCGVDCIAPNIACSAGKCVLNSYSVGDHDAGDGG